MGFVSILFGGSFGLGAQLFSNAIQKVPLSRKPWMHVMMFAAGAYVGAKYPKWEKALVDDINEIRAAKGLSPMVGSSKWVRYQPPEELDMVKK